MSLTILTLVIFFTIVLLVGLYSSVSSDNSNKATATAQTEARFIANANATTTTQAQARATSTAQVYATATAQAQATATSEAQATATVQAQATATMAAIQATVGTLDGRARKIYGPVNGTLIHKANNSIDIISSNVSLRNSLIDANFSNPYSATEHAWDYGFLFRDTGSNKQYRLGVNSNKYWFLYIADGTVPNKPLVSGNLENFNTSANQSNRLLLYVSEDKGFFYVNNIYITTLDLSKKMVAGDIAVGTGFENGDEINGKETRYQNFTIYSLP